MTDSEIFQLPEPTSQTVDGPKLYLDPWTLLLDYDSVHKDGSVIWTRITFRDVLGVNYCQEACCLAEHLDGYNELVKYARSDYLDEMMGRWRNYLRGQASRLQDPPYAHWRIYFNDFGGVDVIARFAEVGKI